MSRLYFRARGPSIAFPDRSGNTIETLRDQYFGTRVLSVLKSILQLFFFFGNNFFLARQKRATTRRAMGNLAAC